MAKRRSSFARSPCRVRGGANPTGARSPTSILPRSPSTSASLNRQTPRQSRDGWSSTPSNPPDRRKALSEPSSHLGAGQHPVILNRGRLDGNVRVDKLGAPPARAGKGRRPGAYALPVTTSKTLGILDVARRAQNALELLRRLLGEDFPKGVAEMSRYRRLLAYARAANKKGQWPKVRFVLGIAEPEAWDASSFMYLRGTPGEVLLDDLEKVLALYGQLEAALRVLTNRALGLSWQFGENPNDLGAALLGLVADLSMNEESSVSSRRLEFLILGQLEPIARERARVPTRVGMTARAERYQGQRLEAQMRKLGFSQSEVGLMIDGLAPSVAAAGRKFAQREAARRRRLTAPREPGTQSSGSDQDTQD